MAALHEVLPRYGTGRITVYRPRVVRPLHPSVLVVFAHRSAHFVDDYGRRTDPRRHVEQRIQGILGPGLPRFDPVVTDSASALVHGTELVIEPWVEASEVHPARAVIRWALPVHQAEFTLVVPATADGRRLAGGVRVLLGVLLLADIRFFVNVRSRSDAVEVEPVESVSPYRKIFASYSHRDTPTVERTRRGRGTRRPLPDRRRGPQDR